MAATLAMSSKDVYMEEGDNGKLMPSANDAELANATANRLYRDGRFEEAVEAYTSALKQAPSSSISRPSADEHPAGDDSGRHVSERRSKYFANRAQAKIQLKEYEEAARDCKASVREDPRNAKALVRWGLCAEAMGRWDEALDRFERGSVLLQPGTALLKAALEGGRRAGANRDVDRKVAQEEAMPEELVHRGQKLRLLFNNPLPLQCALGSWFDVSMAISNEFGLWRRSDFDSAATDDAHTTSLCKCHPDGKSAPPLRPNEREGDAVNGTSPAVRAAKLKLVVEARKLKAFGRRAAVVVQQGHNREGADAIREMDGSLGHGDRSSDAKRPPYINHTEMLETADNVEGCSVAVDTDGEAALGRVGKAAFRARFMLNASKDHSSRATPTNLTIAACAAKSNAIGRCSAVDAATSRESDQGVLVTSQACPMSDLDMRGPRQQSELFLLRVSVDQDEATSLLGRAVVPVLSLPIPVSTLAGGGLCHDRANNSQEDGGGRSSEQRALAADAFQAGATNCREVSVPVAAAAAGHFHRSHRNVNGTSLSKQVNARTRREVLVAESPGQLGISGKVWDSAFVLCDYLAEAPAAAAARPSCDTAHPVLGIPHASDQLENGDCATLTEERRELLTRIDSDADRAYDSRGGPASDAGDANSLNGDHCIAGESGIRRKLMERKRVLELGAGTGLVSICCALLGASAVVATDFEDVTALIRLNAALNFSTAVRQQPVVAAVPLVWGQPSAEVEKFNPEVVVMSDVVYDPAGYEPLLATLLDVMRPEMIAVMAHRHRHPEDHEFFRRLNELFIVQEDTDSWQQAPFSGVPPPTPRADAREGRNGCSDEGTDVQIFRIWTR